MLLVRSHHNRGKKDGTAHGGPCLRPAIFQPSPLLKLLTCLLLFVFASVGLSASNTTSDTPVPLTAKEISQGYRDNSILARPLESRRASIETDESRDGTQVRQKFDRLGDLRVVEVADTDTPDDAIARLQATGRYEYVEHDYIRYVQTSPNDPKFTDNSLWQFNNIGQASSSVTGLSGADISAVRAWSVITDASNIVVAVVDTGVNLSHQDIAANLWTNPSPTKSDLHGANYVGGRGSMVSGDPSDNAGHGTHVAGTIGAVGNNGVAAVGVAWKVQIMAVKVFSASGSGTVSEISAGINYAIAHGANVINASYGASGSTGYSQAELTAITAAKTAGIIFVAAAGNDAASLDLTRSYPASHQLDNIVTVGASNRRDELSSFSNYGAAVDIIAPGEEIVSLDYSTTAGTTTMSGTSMATPHITGAVALLRAQFPTDTYRQTINRLLRGAEAGVGAGFTNKSQTSGRLNLYKALTTTTNRPFNDDFADRPTYTGDNLWIRSNNVGATAESSEPAIAGYSATSTLWWQWTSKSGGTVSVSTSGSDYDTLLAVYTGSALGGLIAVASNDNDSSVTTSRVSFTAQAGVTYQIAVDGKSGASGLTMLTVGTIPSNDTFANATTLSGVSTQVTGTNANCSRETGEPRILNNSGGTSLWYQWTAPKSGTFQVAAYSNDFDPLLAVYTGSAVTSLSLVSSSDNTGVSSAQTASLCTFSAVAGTTYRITVDSKSASTIGQFTLSLTDSVWQGTVTAGITGSPAVGSDGTVYVGSTDQSIYAFSSDGTQKWAYATGGLIDTSSPAISDSGIIYVGSADGKLYALNSDGTAKWTHNFSSTTTVSAGCSPAIGSDGTVYIRITDGYLYALNATDGATKWKINVNATSTSFYGNPVIGPDGTIYMGSDDSTAKFYAINADGTQKWSFTATGGVYGAPAIDASGNLYLASIGGRVYKLSSAGAEQWHYDVTGSSTSVSSSMALSADGGTLYFAAYNKNLYALNTTSGAVRWSYTLGSEVRASSPAVDSNGVIYIGAYDNKLYAINADGTFKRTYDADNIIRSSPVIAGTRLYFGSNDQKLYAFELGVTSAYGPWPQYRHNARRLGRAVSDALAITAQPTSQTAVVGYSVSLSVTVSGQGPFTYQWYKDGTAISGATSATYTVASATTATAGSYTVTITNSGGTVTSNAATITVAAALAGRLTNVSVLTSSGTGSQTLSLGFYISGSVTKPLLVRGMGPSLAALGVSNVLADSYLTLLTAAQPPATIATNDDWAASLASTFTSVGAYVPSTTKDAALTTTLPAGAGYTVQVTGVGTTSGYALGEVYDLDSTSAANSTISRITNVSARAQVGTGNNILTVGFYISGNVPKKLLIRGVGPSLAQFSVTGLLADPTISVYKDSVLVSGATNDDWGSSTTLSSAFTSVGAFSLTSTKDAALVITLNPGGYTVQLSGVGSTTGVGLIEVYDMQ